MWERLRGDFPAVALDCSLYNCFTTASPSLHGDTIAASRGRSLPVIMLDSISPRAKITIVSNKSGAVAQRESTSLARKGSGVQIASAPPF